MAQKFFEGNGVSAPQKLSELRSPSGGGGTFKKNAQKIDKKVPQKKNPAPQKPEVLHEKL